MEKKESPKKKNTESRQKGNWPFAKTSGFSDRIFSIIKLVLGICLLFLVYTSSVSFIGEFSKIDRVLQNYFWWGAVTFLIIYLFIWEPAIIYTKGQRALELTFNLFKPLVRVAPYLFPIYTIILLAAYGLLSLIFGSQEVIKFFMFFFSFSIALHLVFSAKSLRSKQEDFLKANYIFGFSFLYVLNLALLALVLNLVFAEFSFVSYFNNSFQQAKDIFYAVFNQLFLR
ncbi:MAG: hypothetical protein PHT41_00455 [Candidatus Omnitrophica bacterium]|nr:hypothetical protein [Candidatus Omnitrophota bacterium]MDD5237782.1 hypothetical protein [Candidatus Omnitrophota bacterium]